MQECSESPGLHDDENQRGPPALDPFQLEEQVVPWIGICAAKTRAAEQLDMNCSEV
jgi:hypothetical protein